MSNSEQKPAKQSDSASKVIIGDVERGIHGSKIAGRDIIDVVIQIIQQTDGQVPSTRNLPAQLAALQQALSRLTHTAEKAATQSAIEKLEQIIATLPTQEQHYRERLQDRYTADAAYYIALAGETTEVTSVPVETEIPRSARRRNQRALAEYHEWIQGGQEIRRVRLNTLREGVDKYPCIILLGDPGSGKTTATENLAFQFAAEGAWLPLPLRLSEFGPGLTVEEFIVQGWAGPEQAGHWGALELASNLEGYLEEGRVFMLFDGLNEMPHEGYKERVQALRRFIDKWSAKGNRFLVTCRVLDYDDELSGLQRVEVQPLNDEQIKAFLENELPETWQVLWNFIISGFQQVKILPINENQIYAFLEKELLIDTWQTMEDILTEDHHRSLTHYSSLVTHHSLLELARNPYMLTMMIDIFIEDKQLGQNRAELMTRFTQILMKWAKEKCPRDEWLDADIQCEALSTLAFEAQARSGFGTTIKTEQAKVVMPQQVQLDPNWPPLPSPPDQVLTLAASTNIIEMPVDRSSVRFYHQLLQEYFAAREMLKRNHASLTELWRWPWLEEEMPPIGKRKYYEPLPPPPTNGWEETTILAVELAGENQLIESLIPINPILAARCLYETQVEVDEAIRQAVIETLLSTIAQPEVALRVRIAAAEILGYLGDPRLGEMVTVSAGRFLMGDDEGEIRERPQHELYLPAYRIGKYPVTTAEHKRFIEAGGYQDKRWWTEAGWEMKEKRISTYWLHTRFNKPNQPVVGVSWNEAVAYCRWLTAEKGQLYRLPTEAEWEKAARGVEGRPYPWGNEWDPSRLNTFSPGGVELDEWELNKTTPVGIYPTGISPFGLFDCAGNVWEWCATKTEKSYPYDIQEDEWQPNYLAGIDKRGLRGGGFDSGKELVRCAYRADAHPGSGHSFGFRLVCSG